NYEPIPARQIVADLPHDLDRILSRCLRKDPARRFQHLADLHVALNELKEESDSGQLTPTAPLKRRRTRVWLWGSVAAVLVLAAIGAWLIKRTIVATPPQRVVAVTAYPGAEQYPSFSPDGNQV